MKLFWRRFGVGSVVILVCAAFALKALLLVDATSLWSDELYSVGKSFQPSFRALLEMLRNDTHPPVYYTIVWLWGQSVGQNALTLRILSWLAYGLGGGGGAFYSQQHREQLLLEIFFFMALRFALRH